MRKSFWQLCALFFVLLVYPAYSQTVPKMTAKAWLLMDTVSNQVLASRQADMKMGSGTVSKLMTACLVFDALKDGKTGLDQEVEISEKALPPTRRSSFFPSGVNNSRRDGPLAKDWTIAAFSAGRAVLTCQALLITKQS